MIPAKGYAARNARSPLVPFSFERREPRPSDLQIEILYCGVCHSDIHQARDEWGGSLYPMVPGHEIVGKVLKCGNAVKAFRPGDTVGVGCMIDSCRVCPSCREGLEQFCKEGFTGTYNGYERDGVTVAQGGYSDRIVVDEAFVLRIPPTLDLKATAPLLCAGITTYSPLRHWKVGKGMKVGIIGLGGLGHMGVKFARAFGAETHVITSSPGKKDAALSLGAVSAIVSRDEDALRPHCGTFDFLLDTVSAPHELAPYLALLRRDAHMVMVGAPSTPLALPVFSLIGGRKSIAGSLIGGIRETQEMLDFCGAHGIVSDVEVIPIQKINEAYERMLKGDVRYRFVIDMKSLENA